MSDFKVSYKGNLSTEIIHLASGSKILTDAPIDNQGLGRTFSPTDLVASSLASCMSTIIAIAANTHNIDIKTMDTDITKIMSKMSPRKISQIDIKMKIIGKVNDKAKKIIDWVKKEARKKINQASTDLKAGRKFSSVAKEYSEDSKTSEKGGALGVVMKEQSGLLPEVSDALIELKVGETSGIIESDIGFHLVQLNDKKDSQAIPLDEVKAEILNHLLKFETEKQLKDYLSKLRKKSAIKIFF